MPELAELRLTADYINHIAKDKVFYGVKKNPTHKCADLEDELNFPFVIEARSRGKELMLEISTAPNFATSETMQVKHLMMTMGMSGHFKWIDDEVYEKHAHLLFKTEGGSLAFVDVRRFGKWKWGNWGKDRGPDPTTDFQNFVRHVKNNLHKRDFDKPICEALMNQKYFNGIGNYLRAEILNRVNINPFTPARDAILTKSEILLLCRWAPLQAYTLGGGQLKDWENPFGKEANTSSWDEFITCYGNPAMSKMTDRNGRTFWYDPKWDTENNLKIID